MPFCQQCGSEISNEQKFCTSCGAKINDIDEISPEMKGDEEINDVIETCRNHIKNDIGGLEDLPVELANTIANMYFTFHSMGIDRKNLVQSGLPFDLEHYLFPTGIDEFALLKTSLKSMPNTVANLRQIKNEVPDMYDYTVELLLDIFKYRIDNALNKPEILRSMERKFKKKRVREIPDLYKKFL